MSDFFKVTASVMDEMTGRLEAYQQAEPDALKKVTTTNKPKLKIARRPGRIKLSEFSLLAASGFISVNYAGSRYDRPAGLGLTMQEREMFFDVVLLYTNKRDEENDDDEIMRFKGEVIDALLGFKPENCFLGLYLIRDDYVDFDRDKGIFQHGIRFATKTVQSERQPVITEPLLKQVKAEE
jgi:Gp37 protein